MQENLLRERERENSLDGKTLQEYLNDPIFYHRYITHKIEFFNSYHPIFQQDNAAKMFMMKVFRKFINQKIFGKSILERKFSNRLMSGKIDIPHIELVLTTKCTLNCESCNNMMQYFDSKSQYTDTASQIQASLENLLSVVDSIERVLLIGGEPMLFKDIDKIINFLDSQEKIKTFNIVTNATIKFNENVLDALAKSRKCSVIISDYSKSPNLNVKIHIDEIAKSLKERKIPLQMDWQGDKKWRDPGKRYKRGRSHDEIVKNFRACMMRCVSMLDGKIFVCPIASSLSKLKDVSKFAGDFIDLNSQNLSARAVLDFYKQDFFNACDYCGDMWVEREQVTPAVQMQGRLNLEPEA